MQNHEPTSALFLNGHLLGYLPVKDWIHAWHSASFEVPSDYLRNGYNEVMVRAGQPPPKSRNEELNWDEVMFRGIFLESGVTK